MTKDFQLEPEGFHPFGELIGLKFSEVKKDYSRCFLKTEERLLNPHNVLHGGVICSMADTGMGAALYPTLGDEETCTTIEIKITYFKAVTSGVLICDTEVINRGKKIAYLESEIKKGDDLIARASGTFYIGRKEKS